MYHALAGGQRGEFQDGVPVSSSASRGKMLLDHRAREPGPPDAIRVDDVGAAAADVHDLPAFDGVLECFDVRTRGRAFEHNGKQMTRAAPGFLRKRVLRDDCLPLLLRA